jgi:hypothetical protein
MLLKAPESKIDLTVAGSSPMGHPSVGPKHKKISYSFFLDPSSLDPFVDPFIIHQSLFCLTDLCFSTQLRVIVV